MYDNENKMGVKKEKKKKNIINGNFIVEQQYS